MPEGCLSWPGVYGPRELEALIEAYRAILAEICEGGFLAGMSTSSLPALAIRRLAARELIGAAASGIVSPQDLAARAIGRLAALGGDPSRPVAARSPGARIDLMDGRPAAA